MTLNAQNIWKFLAGAVVTAVVLFLLWYFSSIVVYILVSAVLAVMGRPLVRQLVQIRHQGACAPGVKVAQIPGIAHAGAVSAMIVDQRRVAVTGQVFHEGQVAPLVLGHAVGQLYQRPGFAGIRRDQADGQRQSVRFRGDGEVFDP
jgi:hypothetical protein